MTQSKSLYKKACRICPVAQDLQDMLEDYRNYIFVSSKKDVRLWPDYHRGSHRGREYLAHEIVKELTTALEGNGRMEQDRADL